MIGKTLLIVSMVLSMADGCQKDKAAGPKSCDIRVNVHPHHVPGPSGKGRGKIDAAIKAWCDSPPTEHTVFVRLERRQDVEAGWP